MEAHPTLALIFASIISDSGATCSISNCFHPSPSCKFPPKVDPGYTNYVARTHRELITATTVASLIGSALMAGFFANLPITLTPGNGTNAYFAYSVVGFHGSGRVPNVQIREEIWQFLRPSLLRSHERETLE
ncbi:Adenine/guanine permease AZG1 [Platanthera guangdongensis]|uniref:Adenine/guanine permease AZG1 n=1 Tax=Platanthera guangdongensis TaxID=2320717 RepID=A0ABR2MPQ0_9ASPA